MVVSTSAHDTDQHPLSHGRLTYGVGTNADDPGSLWFGPTIDAGRRVFPLGAGEGDERAEPLLALGSTAGVGIRLGPDVQLLVQGGLMTGVAGPGVVEVWGDHYQTLLGPGSLVGEAALGVVFGGFR